MKKYTFPCVYKRQQIYKSVWAKSDSQAAKLFGISKYTVKMYCRETTEGDYFEGCMGYFDSGVLWQKEHSLFMKNMPIEELINLINKHI